MISPPKFHSSFLGGRRSVANPFHSLSKYFSGKSHSFSAAAICLAARDLRMKLIRLTSDSVKKRVRIIASVLISVSEKLRGFVLGRRGLARSESCAYSRFVRIKQFSESSGNIA